MTEMTDLYQKITSLESQHKRSQLTGVYGELMEHRRKLKDLITRKHLRSLQRTKGFYYAHANKGGRYLARLLKGPMPRRQIRQLRLASAVDKLNLMPHEIIIPKQLSADVKDNSDLELHHAERSEERDKIHLH
ncbi:Hypothetical predicted protein [Pelobates cultripes]|uniref:Uncharacterized protein n=1 Tax=Pelobates cultripes TaxID=61616 RepID=A0AAD1RMT3_PELCU|nr:Hypothetical predicted protein [Pelobates cultripes]